MKNKLENKYVQMNMLEEEYKARGYNYIVGIDEVGRGPIAGSLVVAGVILSQEPSNKILGLDDSKKLSKKKIEELSIEIKEKAIAYKIVEVRVSTIEKIGIKPAVLNAMKKVCSTIHPSVDFALIDFEKPDLKIDSLSIKKGDSTSNSIAAASIIAKQFRDKKMVNVHKKYPEYGFDTNVGYGTKKHLIAIDNYGIINNVHRKNFEPIKSIVGDLCLK